MNSAGNMSARPGMSCNPCDATHRTNRGEYHSQQMQLLDIGQPSITKGIHESSNNQLEGCSIEFPINTASPVATLNVRRVREQQLHSSACIDLTPPANTCLLESFHFGWLSRVKFATQRHCLSSSTSKNRFRQDTKCAQSQPRR